MVVKFKFPDVGEGITEGEIVEWLVKEGDIIKEDQALVSVETAKAIVEIPSPVEGVVAEILVKEGKIKVGQEIVVIRDKSEKPERKSLGIVGDYSNEETKKKTVDKNEHNKEQITAKISQPNKALATPKIRALAKQMKIDINLVQGTGTDNRITKEDLARFKDKKTEKNSGLALRGEEKEGSYGIAEHIPLKGLRKTIADNMINSLHKAAHVTHVDSADVSDLVNLREKEKAILLKKNVHLTYLPFIMKAVMMSLKEHPYLNSMIDEDKQEIILKKYYNIGVAVDTPDGLIVPVIKNIDKKSIADIAKEISKLSDQARTRKILIEDLRGGTFTITNIGVLGGLFATPIINYPEAANLGISKIRDEAVVNQGRIIVRKIMYLSLSFDHRIVDGAEAARFTNTIKKYLENPGLLLIDGA